MLSRFSGKTSYHEKVDLGTLGTAATAARPLEAEQLTHLARGAKVGAGTRTSVQLIAVILPRPGPVGDPSGDPHPAAKPQAALN
jgi:hypothetical protein